MTAPIPDTLVAMQSCLDALQLQVDAALGFLLDSCSPDGEFRPSLLDDHQLAAYELAFCAAELQAAAALANHAATAEDELLQALAPGYGADTLQSVWGRLLANASAMGLSRSELLQLMQEPPLAPFLDRHQGESTLAAIGEALLDRGHACLPDGLDSEKAMVRDSFARFTDQVVEPLAEDVHRQDLDIPDSLIEAAAELGCFGACIPQRFGGLLPDDGGDTVGMIVVTEELSRGSLGAAGSLVTRPEIAARALLSGGTARQQQRWLPRLAAAQVLAAIAVTEPDYGSDVASVALRATRVPGGWQLSGSKTWCTFAGKAELLVTLARSAPDPALGHRGLSLFLVEKPAFAGHAFEHVQQSGGKLTGRAIATIGYRGMHSFDLAFDEYFVPEANLVGEDGGEGRGFYHAMAGFAGGRIQTAARATGVMQAALDRALAYAAQRKVFGATIGDYQLTRVKLGRMLGALTASRQFSYAVARMMDEGNGQMEASLVKLFACRAAEWVTREAMQIHGGMGYAEESPVSRYYVDARVLSIFEGAEETLALKVIARDLVANAKRST